MQNPHEIWMQRCLQLAEQGRGKTHPNPMVGCVVLNTAGECVAEGFHRQYGDAHAEAMALALAGEKAQGGTLYVNLEPCNHTGKTPPCAQAILTAGIHKVFYGIADPNPKVTGHGAETLRHHGLQVTGNILAADCQKLNEAFCFAVQTQHPYTIVKQAMSLDGKIATRSGESQWITNPLARQWVHQRRAESDALLTTAETVLKDNSQLTIREAPLLGNPPMRIILDRRGRLGPGKHRLFEPASQGGPIWIFTSTEKADGDYGKLMQAQGILVSGVPITEKGLALEDIWNALGKARLTQLMVEAGGTLAGTLLQEKRIQKLWLIYGNQLLLDPAAKPGFTGKPLFQLDAAIQVQPTQGFFLDNNWILEASLLKP